MKKLLALIAIIGFVPSAYAAEGADFSQSGEFRLQYYHDKNLSFNSSAPSGASDQVAAQRLRWGTTIRAGEKLTGHFTLVDNAIWGENPSQVPDKVGGPELGSYNGATTTPGNGSNVFTVNEAYMSWMATDALMIRAGRGSFTMGDGKLISSNEYEPVWNAFDGVLVSYDHEMLRASLFGVKGASVANDFGTASDNNIARFYGISVDVKTLPDFFKAVNVHFITLRRDEADYTGTALDPLPAESSNRFGASIGGDKMGIDYHVTYESYSGTRKTATTFTASGSSSQSISANMLDAEVGYTLPATMNLRVHVGYHTDTGTNSGTDDNTYQGFYYDRHNNGGYMGVISWGNLTYTDLGVTLQPLEDITVGATYYMMTKTEKNDANYTGAGKLVGAGGTVSAPAAAGVFAGDPNSNKLGNETDIWVTKKYTNNFNISARYSMFQPGQVIKDNNATLIGASTGDTRSQIYLESKLTF